MLARIDRRLRMIVMDLNLVTACGWGFLTFMVVEPYVGKDWASGAAVVAFVIAGYRANRRTERDDNA